MGRPVPSASAVARALDSGLQINRVAPATQGARARAWVRPRSVRGASIRPTSNPSALPVDSPWRTRISTGRRTPPGSVAPGSMNQDAVALGAGGELIGWEAPDA